MNMKQGSSINDQEDQWRECVDASNRHFSAFVDRSAAPARVQRRQEEHLPPYHIYCNAFRFNSRRKADDLLAEWRWCVVSRSLN